MIRRQSLNVGTRSEILSELEELGRRAAEKGDREKATEYATGIRLVEEGLKWVTVRGQMYGVEDG